MLYSQPTGIVGDGTSIAKMSEEAHRRYAEIMRDVEMMIDDHSMLLGVYKNDKADANVRSLPAKPRLAHTLQARDAGAHRRTLLHKASSRSGIQIPRPKTLHILSPLCSAIIQRCSTGSQLGPDHGSHQWYSAAGHL